MKPYIRFVGILHKFCVLCGGPADFDVINGSVVFKSLEFHLSHIFHKICLYPFRGNLRLRHPLGADRRTQSVLSPMTPSLGSLFLTPLNKEGSKGNLGFL
jgi:hypothetical protein